MGVTLTKGINRVHLKFFKSFNMSNKLSKEDHPSLDKLYKSQAIRDTIYTVLGEDYENSFDRIIKEGNLLRSLLIKEAICRKYEIKELVIQYGFEFETLNDLKDILDVLKIWSPLDETDSHDTVSKC